MIASSTATILAGLAVEHMAQFVVPEVQRLSRGQLLPGCEGALTDGVGGAQIQQSDPDR